MWTEITRPQYERSGLRYASDLKDGEWNLIMLLLPPVKRLGRPRTTDLREVLNAILYMELVVLLLGSTRHHEFPALPAISLPNYPRITQACPSPRQLHPGPRRRI